MQYIALWLALTITTLAANAADQPPLILVAPFENLSGRISELQPDEQITTQHNTISVVITTQPPTTEHAVIRDRLREAPRSLLEDALINQMGAQVVERSRADGLLTDKIPVEQAREPAFAVRLAQATGAQIVALGTITEITGSGPRTSAEIRVRLVNATGAVIFSQTGSGFANQADDCDFAAVRAALLNLTADQQFHSAIQPEPPPPASTGQLIEVLFKPSESHCELEIDGLFVGFTPGRFPLPEGRPVRVRISKPGFQTWDRKIMASKDLQLTPELISDSR